MTSPCNSVNDHPSHGGCPGFDWPECGAVVIIGDQQARCDHDQGHDGPHCNGVTAWTGFQKPLAEQPEGQRGEDEHG